MALMPRGQSRSISDGLEGMYEAAMEKSRAIQDRIEDGISSVSQEVLRRSGVGLVHPSLVTASDPARWAEGKVGHGGYGYFDDSSESRGKIQSHLPVGVRGIRDPKCNKFVWDALEGGGRPAQRMPDGRIPVAHEWGDPRIRVGGYAPIDGAPQPGDVVSNGHHVGIYAPLPNGKPGTISAAAPFHHAGPLGEVVHNDWGFRGDEGNILIRRATPSRRRR